MITRLDFLVRLARHEPLPVLLARARLMDDTKQRDEEMRRRRHAADTPWPRGEIFREAIAITACCAKLRSCTGTVFIIRQPEEKENEKKNKLPVRNNYQRQWVITKEGIRIRKSTATRILTRERLAAFAFFFSLSRASRSRYFRARFQFHVQFSVTR